MYKVLIWIDFKEMHKNFWELSSQQTEPPGIKAVMVFECFSSETQVAELLSRTYSSFLSSEMTKEDNKKRRDILEMETRVVENIPHLFPRHYYLMIFLLENAFQYAFQVSFSFWTLKFLGSPNIFFHSLDFPWLISDTILFQLPYTWGWNSKNNSYLYHFQLYIFTWISKKKLNVSLILNSV